MKYTISVLSFVLAILFFLPQWVTDDTAEDSLSDKINLALRKVGDHLLSINGNDSLRIPPVTQISDYQYVLIIQDSISYDTLPALMDKTMKDMGIDMNYNVLIKECKSDSVILGYDLTSFLLGQVPCKGRENPSACQRIILSRDFPLTSGYPRIWSVLGSVFIVLGFISLGLVYKKEKEWPEEGIRESTAMLICGQTKYDVDNQQVNHNGKITDLTYRENKLLKILVENKNQVIEREKIIELVWGDEGVIVGRSLDVFVSRLRKILKPDDTIQIKSVHGVGYRLEETSIAPSP